MSRARSNDQDLDHLLATYDPFDQGVSTHRLDVLGHARRHCPVPAIRLRTDPGVQYRMITRYEDVRFVLDHPDLFSSSGAALSDISVRLPPLDADPPLQQEFRRILNPLLSRGNLLRFVPEMRKIAVDTIATFIADGEVEFSTQFAVPYSSAVLCRIVFDDSDPERLSEALELVGGIAKESSLEKFFQLAILVAHYIEERKGRPGRDDDVITALITGTVEGRPLTDDERIGAVSALFLGGLDTTKNALSSIAYHLARDPALEDRVRDPRWIRRDLDEFLRLECPVAMMGRTVTREVELSGTRLFPGDRIIVNFGSANRDENQFEHADQLDFSAPRSGILDFGLGIHRCVGSNLARLSLEIGFEEVLRRMTRLRLLNTHEMHFITGVGHGPVGVPLTFDRRE